MKPVALVLGCVLSALPVAALTSPYPAGQCTSLDDGVHSYSRSIGPAPHPVSTDLPARLPSKTGGLDKALVVDLVFLIRGDGSVANPRVLCTNLPDEVFASALLRKTVDWRFLVLSDFNPMLVAYRVVVSAKGASVAPVPLPITADPI